MHEFRVAFFNARFLKCAADYANLFSVPVMLAARHPGFARITRVASIFSDSVHPAGACERVDARIPCGFFQCSFSECTPPMTRVFYRYPSRWQPASKLCSYYARCVHLLGFRASGRYTRAGSCTNSVCIFPNARFLRCAADYASLFLGTRHAGSRPPSLARITRVTSIFSDSAHPAGARERVDARIPCGFFQCSFSECTPPMTRVFSRYPSCWQPAPPSFARITRVASIFADSAHPAGARERVDARIPRGFFKCSFSEVRRRLRERLLSTRHAGTQVPSLARITGVASRFSDSVHLTRCPDGSCTNSVWNFSNARFPNGTADYVNLFAAQAMRRPGNRRDAAIHAA
jgi:hypothetical protein